MAKSKLVKANQKIVDAVVGGYKKLENGAVDGFTKISDSFVDQFLTKDGENEIMKKSTFVAMILGTIGGILFALGMCMALISEWNAFRQGVVMGTIGGIVLLIMVIVWRKMENKNPIRISGKTIGTVLLGIIGALLFGVGMCLTMVWSNMIIGIVIGIVGIVVLLCLIPLTKGLK